MSISSSSDEYHSLTSGSDLESCCGLSDDNIQDTGEEFIPYDEALEPVANEEEAAQYLEELAVEEEEEQTLLSRFSGEEDVQYWCKCSNCSLERITKPDECWCCRDIDRCRERMEEVDQADECITLHPGFAACCLNTWVLETAAIRMKTKSKKSYASTRTQRNAAESEFLRSVAYRQYVYLVYGYVGANRRIPLPNCVYNSIRRAFPNAMEEYTGYQSEEEEA